MRLAFLTFGTLVLLWTINPNAVTATPHQHATAAASSATTQNAHPPTTHGSAHSASALPRLPAPAPPPPPQKPASALPMLPQVAAVRLEVGSDFVLLTQEIRLPLGDYHGGALNFFVSFGPVMPTAFDARLGSANSADDALPYSEATPPTDLTPIELVPRVPASARLLLGRPQMAGTVIHVKEDLFRRATAAGDALLLLRSVLPIPPADDKSLREVVARLGAPEGVPITLSHIEVRGLDGAKVEDASAHLCGPHAVTDALSVSLGAGESASTRAHLRDRAISPRNAVRTASDDLCILFRIPERTP